MGLGLSMAIAARTAGIPTAHTEARMVWAIRISMVRKMITVQPLRMAKELKVARPLKMQIRAKTATTPTAHMVTRRDWATNMETRITKGRMATATAIAIVTATAVAKTNFGHMNI